MLKIKKLLLWFLLLNKRFLKKVGLWAILIIIPLLTVALNIVSLEDNGIITVALAAENKNDALANEVINQIKQDNRLMRFLVSNTPDDAERLVKEGEVDAAWIFPDNLAEKLSEFVTDRQSIIRILEREETVPLMLAREKLSGVVFKNYSPSLYIKYVRENVNELSFVSDERLMEYYNSIKSNGDLFEFSYTNENHSTKDATEAGYLLTPIRGLMAIMLVLSGLAAAMFFEADDKSGTFALIGQNAKPFVAGVFHLIPVSLTAISMLVSLYLSGLWVGLFRELLIAFLYALCITVFCMILRLICGSGKVLGAVTPIIMLLFIVICPVFLDIKVLRPIQAFLPTFHYLSAVHNNKFILIMVIYAVFGSMIYFLLSKILKKA